MGLYSGERGSYTGEKHFNLKSVKLTFLSLFQYKARISAFFTSCKIFNMFKVDDKFKNKDIVNVVLTSLLLALNIFHILLQCFYCGL